MKINEVEALVGITKKNIRFYESEGLLNPQRNRENGYRSYEESDVAVLRQIKLLRKLGMPLSEIRAIQQGTLTLSDGLQRHLVVLQRQQENLEQATLVCDRMRHENVPLAELDGTRWLDEMEQMEQRGTAFMDKQKTDIRESTWAAVSAAVVMIALMVACIGLMVWGYFTDPIPLPVLTLLICIPAAVILGVLWALKQRLKDISKGELDEASCY